MYVLLKGVVYSISYAEWPRWQRITDFDCMYYLSKKAEYCLVLQSVAQYPSTSAELILIFFYSRELGYQKSFFL